VIIPIEYRFIKGLGQESKVKHKVSGKLIAAYSQPGLSGKDWYFYGQIEDSQEIKEWLCKDVIPVDSEDGSIVCRFTRQEAAAILALIQPPRVILPPESIRGVIEQIEGLLG